MLRRFFRRLFLMKVEFQLPGEPLRKGYLLGYTSVVTGYKMNMKKAEFTGVTYVAIIEPKEKVLDKNGSRILCMVESGLVRIL